MNKMPSPKAPSVYIGHGTPLNVIWDTNYKKNLKNFAQSIPLPHSVLVMSAHWEKNIPLQITSGFQPQIIYDYYGFPEEMYQLQYNSLGNPTLAKQIADRLNSRGLETHLNEVQGFDHGAWIPMKIMFPEANIPLLQISIPIPRKSKSLFKIGQLLAEFRKEGVMLLGSGNLVHNLPYVFQQVRKGKLGISNWIHTPEEKWAVETDRWIKEKINDNNIEDLLESSIKAPHFNRAAPTTEHFDPLYFVIGTLDQQEGIAYIHEGFEAGSISMRSFTVES
ncbi:MAG: DODA-type extradiol aromatic ring-opening family dioxygenase [Candidatus Hodarchaeota archaeon]